jgi:hypothetical protein
MSREAKVAKLATNIVWAFVVYSALGLTVDWRKAKREYPKVYQEIGKSIDRIMEEKKRRNNK